MQVSLEKAASVYANTFAGIGTKKQVHCEGMSVSDFFRQADAEKEEYLKYNKLGVNDGASDKSNAWDAKDAKKSVMDFLNQSIDTLKSLVTDEDYSKYSELGLTADKDDMTTIVTVYERIQIQLAAYGEGACTSLNISDEKINKVIKSDAVANSLDMASEIGNIDDNAKAFLLKNNMEPTVENVYKAVHSKDAMASENVKTFTDEEWTQLEGQVEKFLEKNGIEISEESLNACKWLISRNVSLNTANLINFQKLSEAEDALTRDMESVKANIVLAQVVGLEASKGYITEGWMNTNQADEAIETINGADGKAIEYIVDNELTLNVANLKKYANLKNQSQDNRQGEKNDEAKYSYARRVLEEAKAVMTSTSLLMMEKLGVDITYTDIEALVEQIKENNEDFAQIFFEEPTTDKAKTLTNFMNIMTEIPKVPIAAVGEVVNAAEDNNVENIYNRGIALKDSYERANVTYEAVGTQVRKDLGDNINKAFNNIDEILKDISVDVCEETRRAVRVLGYNSMNVTRESVLEIAKNVSELDKLIRNITPKTAAYLIENGINPLSEDISVLNEKLELLNEEIGADVNESYSKYLWKLEKSGKVSKEEREAYIELYRALKSIEKQDAKAVGAVADEGVALTLSNLIQAQRAKDKAGRTMDIDDNTGFYEGKILKNRLERVFENIAAKQTQDGTNFLEKTVDELEEIFLTQENIKNNRTLESNYTQQMTEEMRAYIEKFKQENTQRYTEEMMLNMLDGNTKPSVVNMYVAAMLMTKGSEIRTMLKERVNAQKRLLDAFESEEKALEAYEELAEESEEMYGQALDNGEDYQRLKALSMAANYMVNSAKNKCYNIPVEMGDDEVMVKVKFIQSQDETSISISFADENLGVVETKLKPAENSLSGYIICENEKTAEFIKARMDDFIKEVGRDTNLLVSTNENRQSVYVDFKDRAVQREYTDRQLYEISKSFLKAVKVFGGLPINNID